MRFFVPGFEYHLLGFIPDEPPSPGRRGRQTRGDAVPPRHGRAGPGPVVPPHVRDAGRRLTIGLAGVALALVLGVFLGGVSGYYGGAIDTVIQRVIEILRSIPTIPLWMGLAAALPNDWSVIQVYFAITVIISLIGWTELARVVRGRFLSLREEEFVMAAELSGCSRTADHPEPHGAVVPVAHHRGDDPGHPGHDHQRDVAVVPGPGPPSARRSAGACSSSRPRTSRRSPSRPGSCTPPSRSSS